MHHFNFRRCERLVTRQYDVAPMGKWTPYRCKCFPSHYNDVTAGDALEMLDVIREAAGYFAIFADHATVRVGHNDTDHTATLPLILLILRGHASFDPAAKLGDLLLGPLSIARHRAVRQPLKDNLSICANFLVVPEVEGELH